MSLSDPVIIASATAFATASAYGMKYLCILVLGLAAMRKAPTTDRVAILRALLSRE